ncbi:MAG: succinate dehydrogenase assembly factor 2 [Sphingomonadales bacterium]|nr:succinate dehydrogenase assembly factor 2 [Sphingomonadales bacterium]
MDRDAYIRKLRFRASHRGTREADAMVGGFFETYHGTWDAAQFAWFERLLEEQDVDIMAWAMGIAMPPETFRGGMMDALKMLDFITLPPGLIKKY